MLSTEPHLETLHRETELLSTVTITIQYNINSLQNENAFHEQDA